MKKIQSNFYQEKVELIKQSIDARNYKDSGVSCILNTGNRK